MYFDIAEFKLFEIRFRVKILNLRLILNLNFFDIINISFNKKKIIDIEPGKK
jgi:uncharacterized Rmd1/YagE family protein